MKTILAYITYRVNLILESQKYGLKRVVLGRVHVKEFACHCDMARS
jgi:hypothetical protein